MVTVISALRFATTTQGVTQAVGLSSPDNSAFAPGGVDAIEIFSVVPRLTEAQPTHGNAIAAAKISLIIGIFPIPRKTHRATAARKQVHARRDDFSSLIAGAGNSA